MPTKKKEDTAARGPWWVTDSSGAQFATYKLVEGLNVTDEDPFDRNGNLRRAIPANGAPVNPAQATTEGIVP